MYRREKRKFFILQNEAACFVQTWFRSSMYRRQFLQHLSSKKKFLALQHKAATFVQSWFRTQRYHRRFLRHCFEKKKHLELQNQAAIYIQKWFLSSMYRRNFIRHLFEKQKRLELQNRAALFIQNWFKMSMYRREFLNFCQHSNGDSVHQIIKMQAVIRGKLQRIECANDEKLQNILHKAQIANANWRREDSVNYRLQCALHKLNQSRTLFGVSEACATLENLLSIVPNISKRIVEHDIIGTLYNVLRNSNRSQPHLKLVTKILNFFILFAKTDIKCYEAIFYRDDTLDILSERLQIHRLDFVLFELTTQLFFIGADIDINESNKFLINLRQSDVSRQIRTVQKIMCSKLEIAKRVNKPLRKIKNAKFKYKVKFKQEQILSKCVQNMTKLVDKL